MPNVVGVDSRAADRTELKLRQKFEGGAMGIKISFDDWKNRGPVETQKRKSGWLANRRPYCKL
jgi:hypothetical protein